MVSAGTISVELDANTAEFVKKMAKAADGLNKVGPAADKIKKGMDAVEGGFSRVGNALHAATAAAAGWVAVSKAFKLGDAAAGAKTASQVFEALGGSIDDLRTATMGMITDANLVKKANLAETMGITGESFKRLGQIAIASAAKTGQSVSFMFDSIITGSARQSKAILDNLGIVFDTKAALNDYASSIGKTSAQLTDAQKKQAFMNAVFSQGEKVINQLKAAGISVVDPFARISTVLKNLQGTIGGLLIPAFERLEKLVDPLQKKLDEFKEAWSRLNPEVKEAITNVILVAGGFSALFAGIIAVVSVISAFAGAITGAISALTGILGPLLMVVVIVGTLVSLIGAARVAWEENWGGIADRTSSGSLEIISTVRNMAKAILTAFFTIIKGLADLMDFIVRGLIELMSLPSRAIAGLVDLVSSMLSKLVTIISDVFVSVLDEMLSLVNRFPNLAEKLGIDASQIEGARNSLKGLAGEVTKTLDSVNLGDEVEGIVMALKDTLTIQLGEPEDIAESFLQFPGEMIDALSGLDGTGVEQALKDGGDLVAKGWKLLFNDVLGGFEFFNDKFKDTVKKIPKDKGKKAPGAGGAAAEAKKDLPNLFGVGASGGGDAALAAANPAIAGLKKVIDGIKVAFDKFLEVVSIFDARLADAFAFAAPVFLAAFAAVSLFAGAIATIVVPLIALSLLFAPFVAFLFLVISPFIVLIAVVGLLVTLIAALVLAIPVLFGAVFGLAAIFLFLTRETESFKRFTAAFQQAITKIVTALEPFFEAMFPLIGVLSALVDVVVVFATAFANAGVMGEILFDVFKFGALVVAGFLVTLGFFQNALLTVGAALLDFAASIPGIPDSLHSVADAARAMKVDTDELKVAFNDLKDLTIESALAEFERLDALAEATESSEELINLPAGFKIAAARFRAADPDNPAGSTSGLAEVRAAGAGGGSAIENVENIIIQEPTDFQAFIDQVLDAVELKTFQATGSVLERASMFSRAGD